MAVTETKPFKLKSLKEGDLLVVTTNMVNSAYQCEDVYEVLQPGDQPVVKMCCINNRPIYDRQNTGKLIGSQHPKRYRADTPMAGDDYNTLVDGNLVVIRPSSQRRPVHWGSGSIASVRVETKDTYTVPQVRLQG